MSEKWINRFMALAQYVAGWSRDPSTKVGCVVVREDNTVATMGFNGFPRGVEDQESRYENRSVKYPMVVHAELNAILTARERLDGMSLFCWPFPPCADCAGAIIQAGISKVYTRAPTQEEELRWGDSLAIAMQMFTEAGVLVYYR